MIYFGPAGNSESFYEQGHKNTFEAFEWLYNMGLNAFEYSFGRGVRLGQAAAEKIAEQAALYSVRLSVHAPYYINLATDEPQKQEGNARYFLQSATAAHWMGAKRVVFHAGSHGKLSAQEAFERAKNALRGILDELEKLGLFDIEICPETMGRIKQIGDLDEVIALCKMDERLVPAIDFAHLHARGRGALNTEADFAAVLDKLESGLGGERAKHFHVHFARIEYTAAGEKMHRTFADTKYGPDFEPFAAQIVKRGLEPTLICESRGTMAEDAAEMKRIYLETRARA